MLESGQLVAFPTETVYGLGADAENPAATATIFELKNRPANHPLIVHVSPEADIGYWSSHIPDEAKKLIDAFWPGPLTLILKRASHIPAEVAGGQDSVGLRCPSHPVAQALLRAFKDGKGGIAALQPIVSDMSVRQGLSMSGMNSVTIHAWLPYCKAVKATSGSSPRFWICRALKPLVLFCSVPGKYIHCK